ncbi:Protein of unknown function [Flavobacteriaceae bacterium MAR_2010_188]|nr:Protein of unknown function [Flavobacteriaceae bacterium MAR_2010_188]
MKKMLNNFQILFVMLILLVTGLGYGQTETETEMKTSDELKTYVIERNIADVGDTSMEDLVGISQKSCSVLDDLGADKIQWLHSYVAEDKIYCVYKAINKEVVKEHADKGGFPANSIMEVSTIISPETAKKEPHKG